MKKIIAFVCSLCLLAGCGGRGSEAAIEKYGSDVLKVFNWGEYIGEDVIANFEAEYGVRVVYETFLSNEEMYTKLQGGDTYDVLIPSDYMIERLKNENLLQPLDHELIPNLYVLDEGVKGLPYDPENEYSVPYFWGSVGIVYNKKNVPTSLIEKEGFKIFHNTKYKGKIFMYDSERDSFMIALKNLGYSMNSSNEKEIQEAYEWLLQVHETMEPAYVTDEVIDGMAQGQKDLAIVYSGDASYILSENEEMGFYCPSEGTNLWSDAMVIPANAKNPKLAHEFINYVLDYDAAYSNSEYTGYTSSNTQVIEDMSGEGGDYEEINSYLPRSKYELDEVFSYNQLMTEKLANLWLNIKSK